MIEEVSKIAASNEDDLNTSLSSLSGQDGGRKKRRGKSNRRPTKKGNKKRRPTKKNRTKKSKKGSSPWILHVKAYAKKHNIKFPQALREAGKSFKK
jgi:hypothetical protein